MIKTMTLVALAATAGVGAVAADENPHKKEVSYSYIEGAWSHDNFNANGVGINDRDGIGNTADDNFGTLSDTTGKGGGGRVSFALPWGSSNVGLHLIADYLQTGHTAGISITDEFGAAAAAGSIDLDQKEFRAAFGVHSKASKYFSVFAELGFTNNKINFGDARLQTTGGPITASFAGASGKRTAFDGRIGARAIVFDRTELLGYVRYHGNGKLVTADDGTIGFDSKILAGTGAYYHISDQFQIGGDYEFGRPGRLRLAVRFTF